ncbi:nitroreductase family protein [Desulfosporosinus sp. PR]|uniref:nitroreductase family protein n=1 Tax=Candidatus Desulfosporosinus nitrosoreducens TaxID=3401928 RepID=UPI0027F776A9|nr:nitroreductase family protein [Desulfosporosinus sp. PR]MDQ7094797.1 nitroreductase family protein [Desulfosporosinus sp. PR]
MLEQIKNRRSIRRYLEKPVDDGLIMQLLESARLAPSGDNTQPWHFIVVKSEHTRQKLVEVSNNQKWMLTAPVFIVCVADIRSRITDNVQISLHEDSPELELKQIIRDTSIAIEHIVLEANNLGLGTCWVAWFTQEEIRPILNIPNDKYVICILTLGYAGESPKDRPRKKLEEVIHYESW